MTWLNRLPLLVLLTGIACVAMIVPAVVALSQGDYHDARSFFYSGVIGLIVTSFVAVALSGRKHNQNAIRQLIALLAAFVFLPLALAVPFYEAVRTTSFVNAYFEMVSSFSTTGATLFDPSRLSIAEHLWRGIVGWLGGLLMWVSAAAILAPLALGGFEITAGGRKGRADDGGSARSVDADPVHRVERAAAALVPIYVGLTAALALALKIGGDTGHVAVIHAMSTMATSGISPIGGMAAAQSGWVGEAVIFLFLLFALSRLTFSSDTTEGRNTRLRDDPELRVGAALVGGVTLVLFLRHFVAAYDVGTQNDLYQSVQALWGSLFTVLSYLTTTGFESGYWDEARNWTALQTPGLLLMGLAILGGGVATTAGGVKLLRVFALYRNGAREVERLLHPSSLGSSSVMGARIRKEGAVAAWVFFMLFAITIAGFTLVFGALGLSFEQALIVTIAGLTNAGPLVTAVADVPTVLIDQSDTTKLVLCGAMVLGRLELLAILAMLTPDAWRE